MIDFIYAHVPVTVVVCLCKSSETTFCPGTRETRAMRIVVVVVVIGCET